MGHFDAPSPLLHEIFALHGRWRGGDTALVFEDERHNWRDFVGDTNRVANALIGHGIVTGDRVAVLMTNGVPMVHALFGCMTAGCASVPINLTITDEAVCGMVLDSEARVLIATPDQQARVEGFRDRLPADLLLVSTGPGGGGWVSWGELLGSHGRESPAASVHPDTVLNVIYSSGTTGTPKGIVHTQGGRRDWAYDLAIALRYHGHARTLVTIGLYSNVSWVAMLCTLLCGGTLVVQPRFDPAAVLDTIAREGITHTAMVPIQFQRIVEQLPERNVELSSMQAMMSCGSPLHEALKRSIFAWFPCGVIELYGLTEGIITTLDPEDAQGRWASVGKPLLGTDIRIVGDDDREAPAGGSGEIVSRGRITMPGYLNRPDANGEATWLDESGNRWLRSGDIGRIDDEGFLYIVDRKKDMILTGGQNVYPQDIESVLIAHELVLEVAVIGARSGRWGETPIAIVVPRSKDADADVLRAWCNERVGKHQRIADVIFADGIPRNPNGKILKRELRETYASLLY